MSEQIEQELRSLEREAEQDAQEQEAEFLEGEEVIQEEEIPTKEVLLPVVGFACDILAPNWDIKEMEKEALAGSYAEVFDKYFPNSMGKLGVEFNALLITVAIFAPRIKKPRFYIPPEAEAEEEQMKEAV